MATMNINEQTLYDLADRTSSPNYQMDQFLAASLLPQNKAPIVKNVTSDQADYQRIAEYDASRSSAQLNNGGSQPGAPAFLSEVSKQIESLLPLIDDKDSFLPALAQVKASIAAKDADFMKEASAQSYTKHNVLAFEKAVQDNIAMDDASPGYRQKYGTADSDETIAARKALSAAKNAADGSIPEALRSNPAYLGFKEYAVTRIGALETLFMKGLNKEEAVERQAEIEMSGYMPEQRAALEAISGFKDPVQQWKFTQAQGKNKQLLLDAISSTPEQLALQTLGGNPYAERLVRQKEHQVLGAEEADERLKLIAGVVADPVVANNMLEKLINEGGVNKLKADEYRKKAAKALQDSQDPSKGAQQMALAFRKDVAMQMASHVAQKAFDEDMLALRGKSKVPLPTFLEEASKNNQTGIITKEKALLLVKQAPNVEERQLRLNQLVEYYGSAAETQNESIFFKLQPMPKEKIKVEAALMDIGLFPAMGQFADKVQGIEKAFVTGEGFDEAVQGKATDAGQMIKQFLFGRGSN